MTQQSLPKITDEMRARVVREGKFLKKQHEKLARNIGEFFIVYSRAEWWINAVVGALLNVTEHMTEVLGATLSTQQKLDIIVAAFKSYNKPEHEDVFDELLKAFDDLTVFRDKLAHSSWYIGEGTKMRLFNLKSRTRGRKGLKKKSERISPATFSRMHVLARQAESGWGLKAYAVATLLSGRTLLKT